MPKSLKSTAKSRANVQEHPYWPPKPVSAGQHDGKVVRALAFFKENGMTGTLKCAAQLLSKPQALGNPIAQAKVDLHQMRITLSPEELLDVICKADVQVQRQEILDKLNTSHES